MDNGSQTSGRGAGGAAVTGSTKAANRRVNMRFFANSGGEAPF